jgi:hypothetical protein
MGSLFTTGKVTLTSGTVRLAGTEIIGIPSGSVFLDFVAGTITLPEGSPTPLVRPMSKNLNDLGLNQCNSLGVWVSDADATIHLGSAITLADHQLSHVVNNYGFSNVRIEIPANSTPDDTNQIFFMASSDGWLGYGFPNISHQRGSVSDTSTDASVIYLSKHVGAYNQFMITTHNTDGADSLDLRIQYSEDGTNWFNDDGYSSSAVTVTAGNNDTWASEIEHHFYRVSIVSTSAGNPATFVLYYNFVNDRGSSSF